MAPTTGTAFLPARSDEVWMPVVDVSARNRRPAVRVEAPPGRRSRRPGPPERPRPGRHSVPDLHAWSTGPIPAVPAEPETEVFPAVSADPAAPPRPVRGRGAARVGVVLALGMLVSGAGTAAVLDKTVTLTVDGRDRTVHTFAREVGGALASAGIA